MRMKGKRLFIQAMGCRTNQYEADAVASMFRNLGAEIAEDPTDADVAILNTCTVTSRSDRKVRQAVRRIRRSNPGLLLLVTGCWAQRATGQQARSLGIDLLVGNRKKSDIPRIVMEYLGKGPEESIFRVDVMHNDSWDDLFMDFPVLHTRAFVKVQDGCSHFCTYCIIPHVRGRPVSRTSDDVIKEVSCLADRGIKEIVLTGVHLGSYLDGSGITLAGLVGKVGTIEGVERIRFGSIEPFTLDDYLLKTLGEVPAFCPHLHIPLQSGDDQVLERMKRGYTSSAFCGVLDRVRNSLGSDIHISTDVMVGFPGETEKAFENTLKLIERAGFGKVHVFPFSAREGTPAFNFSGKVSSATVTKRTKRAAEIADAMLEEYCSAFVGRRIPVLVERSGTGGHGLIPHFLRVNFNSLHREGSVVDLKIGSCDSGILQAEE
jgi:threonylcarbamoyladenosine tRNA methylthiotransferase MtaB